MSDCCTEWLNLQAAAAESLAVCQRTSCESNTAVPKSLHTTSMIDKSSNKRNEMSTSKGSTQLRSATCSALELLMLSTDTMRMSVHSGTLTVRF